jgi:hypothetical protein
MFAAARTKDQDFHLGDFLQSHPKPEE